MKKALILVLLLLTLTLTSCGKNYLVTFDTQGGTPIEAVEVKKRNKVERPADPTKDGYQFIEWQLNGETFDFDTKIKEDITLVAVWKQTGPTSLAAPTNVVISGNTITWNAVNGATEYEVYVDGAKHTTKTTSLNFDFSNSPLSAVVVVAKCGNVVSSQSEPTIYEKTYTKDEIYDVLGGQVSIDKIEQYPEVFNTCAQVVTKYNIDMNIFYGDYIENIYQYAKTHRPIDLVLAGLTVMHSALSNDPYYQPEAPTKYHYYTEELKYLYNEMCQKGLIENTTSDPYEHDKFILFVVPCIMSSISIGKDNYDNAKELILDMLYNGYQNVKIERVGNGYLVTRTILNKQMLFTDEELNKFLQYFRSLGYDSWLYQNKYKVKEAASFYLDTLESYQAIKNILVENEKISKELLADITMDKDSLNQIILDLIDAYEIVLGYEEKVEQLINDFKTADSEDKINLLVEDAKNFSEQVSDLIKDTLPTKEEVDELMDLVKYAKTLLLELDSYVATDFAEYIVNVEKAISVLEAGLNDAITLTNKVLDIVDKIEVNELKNALSFATNLTTDLPKEVVDLGKKLFSELTKVIGDFEFSSGLVDLNAIELFNQILISGGSPDAIGVIELVGGLDLTQKEIDLVIKEAYNFIYYILKYDFNPIIDLLTNQETSEDYLLMLSDKIDHLFGYAFEYVTKDLIKKYESYIINGFENNGYDTSYYQVLLDNLEAFKKYFKINTVCSIISSLRYELSMSSHTECKVIFYYLKQSSNQDVKSMAQAYVQTSIKFNDLTSDYYNDYLNSPIISDFQGTMSILEKLLEKQEFELTQTELDLIASYRYNHVFDYAEWSYPTMVEITFDDNNQQIIFSIKDQYDSQYDFYDLQRNVEFIVVTNDFGVYNYYTYIDLNDDDEYILPYQTIYNIIGTDKLSKCVKIYIEYVWFSFGPSSSGDSNLKGSDLTHIIK